MKIERLSTTKLSVLIVDDEEDIRETLKTYLEMTELFTSVVEAKDGADAYTKTQNQTFDLIILDLLMPKVNGLTFAENLQKSDIKKPVKERASVILLSGSITSGELKQAIELGVKNILTKPCSAQDFTQKVQEVLLKEKRYKFKNPQ